ncbi:MAG: dihydroorotase [Gammaproteobacteria bacterium]|nr:dihydroorotase [Gammaproteobacteria bacterium]MBK88532.1 dihydroorotase [Gammaproteobacteria bacterium]|tara:strand:- start:1756 stop:2799 length:1044 start_codon:yes stop_codon:yes gene_type:complete
MDELTLRQPDDWHVHLRDEDALATTVPAAARAFGRSIVMPNLVPPVTTLDRARAYYQRIIQRRPAGSDWQPLMVLYLTDNTSPSDIRQASDSDLIYGCKYYPAGATTNSDSGVTDLSQLGEVFAAMQEAGLVLQLHGEVTDSDVDIFDREAVFIERYLEDIVQQYPQLKIILEHVTTEQGVDFVRRSPANVAATITPQHLLYNRNDMLVGGMRPHLFCLPVLKRDTHQRALIEAATSGDKKFFLGTDSAPHPRHAKEAECCSAGCYSHHAALELYAEVFEREGALAQLESFASINGPEFYELPLNQKTVSLKREDWSLPAKIDYGAEELVPLAAGETLRWRRVPSGA